MRRTNWGRLLRERVWLFPVSLALTCAVLAGLVVWADWGATSDQRAERAYAVQLSGGEARGLFREAVVADAASAYRWADYAEATGDATAMRRAVELGPFVGPVVMRAVNLAYAQGDAGAALRYGRQVLAMTPAYDAAVFRAWDQMALDPLVSREGVPDPRSAESLLLHRTAARDVAAVLGTWKWMGLHGWQTDQLADRVCGFLLSRSESELAANVWMEYAGARYTNGDAVWNGGFEREPVGRVFDWRIDAIDAVRIERRERSGRDGTAGLTIEFTGASNPAFAHVSQRVPVVAADYELSAWIRTDAVSTDQGVGLQVTAGKARAETERVRGTSEWKYITASICVPAGAAVAELRVVRSPSMKFDNKIAGRVSIDDVKLRRITSAGSYGSMSRTRRKRCPDS